ncbi:MAG: hypothetical protein K2Y56_18725 [Methylobacterium sp.]|uniref:hypothetical protein n=1 Tax=Methylobacterium sp. TaxID=409 RepID=UPI0025F5466E|nr:hypothetical protein [Methylobacterium sp.]MBX9933527.1 hypothetical protein [Methylobacterium sp.]
MTMTTADALDARARETEAGPSVAEQIRELARAHGVVYERSPLDDYAETISRLSDAEVTPDETECLLRALTDAGVITPEQRFCLHAAYLRQSRA